MSIKTVYFDLETTGVNPNKHGVHQISGAVEIDGEIKEWFDFKVKPKRGKLVSQEALDIAGVTLEDLEGYPEMADVYKRLSGILCKYIDKYDKKDKAFFCAYNAHFDNGFMRQWLRDCGDNYFGSYFYSGSIDVMVLALYALRRQRVDMPSFKLMTVAEHLGVEVDESRAHDGLYDIEVTRNVLKILEERYFPNVEG